MGTVHVCSSDQTQPELDVKNIRDAERVKELLHEQVEKMKLARRVRINELIDDGNHDDEGDDFDQDFDGHDER